MRRLLALPQLVAHFERSEQTIRGWEKRGCPGFSRTKGRRVIGEVGVIEAWIKRTRATKPGPKVSAEDLKAIA